MLLIGNPKKQSFMTISISFSCQTLGCFEAKCKVSSSTKIDTLLKAIAHHISTNTDMFILLVNGERVNSGATLGELNLDTIEDAAFQVFGRQYGRKPVIYIFSPKDMEVRIELSLTSSWKFTALYPVVPIKVWRNKDIITWDIHTKTDGTLTELNTGLDVAYLYWEAA